MMTLAGMACGILTCVFIIHPMLNFFDDVRATEAETKRKAIVRWNKENPHDKI